VTTTAVASHTALVYGGEDHFTTSVGAYLEEGVARDERVLAVVPRVKIERLRDELGAEAQRVHFIDAAEGYRPQWNVFRAVLDQLAQAPDRHLRVVAEQDLAARSPAEVRDYQRLEAVANVVFRDHPLTLLCPYDADVLSSDLFDISRRTHSTVMDATGWRPNEQFSDPAAILLGLASVTPSPAGAAALRCEGPADVSAARRFVRDHAARAGLHADAIDDLALAITEVLTNALTHGRPPRLLHVYDAGATWVCHVHDSGPGPDDPFTGFTPPSALSDHGYGLWLARQLCDAVDVGVDATGTHVRLHVRLPH
jgi:anti-sigma regulatory factor (Ser/Thr protein kinase)